MHPDGPGPAFVLYPPLDEDNVDGISSLVSTPSSNSRPPDDYSASNVQEAATPSFSVRAVVTTSAGGVRGGASKTNEGVGAAGVGAAASESVPAVAAASASSTCMSRDLATKFDALKRRKANGDAIEACHVALAEEALLLASAEIAQMQRACAELEGRLDDDDDHEFEHVNNHERRGSNRNGGAGPVVPAARGRGRGRARREEANDGNNDDGFPLLLPRVVVVTSSDHSTRDDHDLGEHEDEFEQHPLDVQHGDDEHSELGGGESSSDP